MRQMLVMLAGLSLIGGARAEPNGADKAAYDTIARRNVFGLVVVYRGDDGCTNVPPPATELKLTGIITVLGDKRALFLIKEPGKPAGKEQSLILAEGQRQGGYEVLQVDEKAGSVKLKSDGKISIIHLASAKLPEAPATPAAPAAMPNPARRRTPAFIPPPPLPTAPELVPEPGETNGTTSTGRGVLLGRTTV
jgi:hypothetical protein